MKPITSKIKLQHKKCTQCGVLLPVGNFHRDTYKKTGLQSSCIECNKRQRPFYTQDPHNKQHILLVAKNYRETHKDDKGYISSRLCGAARKRAKKKGLPFNITKDDIMQVFYDYCPALGIKLRMGDQKVHDCSPTLDRLIPELGYIKGNIAVISSLANRIKSTADAELIQKVADWIKTFKNDKKERP